MYDNAEGEGGLSFIIQNGGIGWDGKAFETPNRTPFLEIFDFSLIDPFLDFLKM